MDGATSLATQSLVPVSSTAVGATFSISTLTVGTHSISANYIPSGIFAGSNAGLSQVINGVPTNLTFTPSANPAPFGQNVTFTSTVNAPSSTAGPPTGLVVFTADGTTVLGNTAPLTPGSTTAGTGPLSPSVPRPLAVMPYKRAITRPAYSAGSIGSFYRDHSASRQRHALRHPQPRHRRTERDSNRDHQCGASSELPSAGSSFMTVPRQSALRSLIRLATLPFSTTALTVGTHNLRAGYFRETADTRAGNLADGRRDRPPKPQDFALTASTPSLAVRTEHHFVLDAQFPPA